jgi:4-diphosphocytidyl-2-C-methyl-D-erythritol kinase
LGVAIDMSKVLPMGGGLGGGSSDAATVLVALNRLWQLGWGKVQLAELGLQLGADVPIFIHGHAAWAEGVGEQFQDINPEEPWYLVIIPPVSVSTAKIFSDPALIRNAPAITIRDFLADATVENVLQPVVIKHYPEVSEALEWLTQYSDNARMTGSGACVFAAFADEQQAKKTLGILPGSWQGFVARGCNISPLVTAMKGSC